MCPFPTLLTIMKKFRHAKHLNGTMNTCLVTTNTQCLKRFIDMCSFIIKKQDTVGGSTEVTQN